MAKSQVWTEFYRPFNLSGEESSSEEVSPLSLKGPRISAGAEGNQNLPHFRIPDELKDVLPENPEQIDIVPVIPEYFLNTWFARYDASNSMQCRGSGDSKTPGLERDRKSGIWKRTSHPCGRGCPSYDMYLSQRGKNAQDRQKVKQEFEREYKRPVALCTGLEVRLLFLVVGQDGKLYGPCDLRSHSIYFLNDAAAQVKVLLQMEAAGRIDLWRSVLTLHKQKQRVGLANGPSRDNYTVGLKVKYLSVVGLSTPEPKVEPAPILELIESAPVHEPIAENPIQKVEAQPPSLALRYRKQIFGIFEKQYGPSVEWTKKLTISLTRWILEKTEIPFNSTDVEGIKNQLREMPEDKLKELYEGLSQSIQGTEEYSA